MRVKRGHFGDISYRADNGTPRGRVPLPDRCPIANFQLAAADTLDNHGESATCEWKSPNLARTALPLTVGYILSQFSIIRGCQREREEVHTERKLLVLVFLTVFISCVL